MANNFNSEVLSDGNFYWFHGQIVDDSTWQKNIIEKGHVPPDRPGWGHRYKVRIFGQHTPNKKLEPPDEQLPMCEVLLPVTGGSGIYGSKQTPNLSQGDYVIGFYKDGVEQNEPVILGCYSTGAQTNLFPGDPPAGFIPRTGYKGLSGDKVVHRKDQVGDTGKPRENTDDPNQQPASNFDQEDDFEKETQIQNNCESKNSEMKGVQLAIKNLLKSVNKAKKATQTVQGALGAFNAAGGPDFITNELNKASQLISGFVKSILTRIRGYVNLKITNAIKDVTALTFPNQRQKLQKASETGLNTFYCVIEKLIDRLLSLVNSLLKDLIDKFVNAPLCAAEQFIGDLLGNLMGDLINGISSALAPITSLVGSIANQVSGIADGVMNALNIASNILQFFSCDNEQLCPDYDSWTWGSGAQSLPSPSAALGKKLEEYSSNINIPGGGSAPPCNTSGIPCGPPQIQFVGNSVSPATGNLVVSAAGAILGVDLTGSGSGYTSPPLAVVVDMCGLGQGAVLETEIDPLLTGPSLVPVAVGSNGGSPVSVGGTGGTPVTTPDGTPVTAGGTGGTPVVVPSTTTTTPGITTTGTGGTPIVTTSGTPLTVGGTGGTPVYAGGSGGTPVTTPNGTPVTAGGNGGTSLTTTNGTPIVTQSSPGGVTSVQVVDPGFGYLPAPNGSVGGNGDVFANNNDAIYTSSNGNIDSYPPGTTIAVTEGGTLGLPSGTTAEVYDNDGNLVQTVVGTGLLTPTVIDFGGQIYSLYESLTDGNLNNIPSQSPDNWLLLPSDFEVSESTPLWDSTYSYSDGNVVKYNSTASSGTVTIPDTTNENITVIGQSSNLSSGNTYPVVLCLEEVVIDNPGYLYDPSDNIFITPSNGTQLEVKYDQFGRVTKVDVIKKGCGFTDIPEIGIISLTGYNAKLRPILRPRRVGEDEQLPDGIEVISVVDCVGKV